MCGQLPLVLSASHLVSELMMTRDRERIVAGIRARLGFKVRTSAGKTSVSLVMVLGELFVGKGHNVVAAIVGEWDPHA